MYLKRYNLRLGIVWVRQPKSTSVSFQIISSIHLKLSTLCQVLCDFDRFLIKKLPFL